MFKWLLCVLLLCVSSPAFSQVTNCPTYDTVTFNQATGSGSVVIANCTMTTPTPNLVYIIAQGEVTCTSSGMASLSLFGAALVGGRPKLGASFNGQISGTTLTVNSMITPGTFLIQAGQRLYDTAGGSQIPLAGQDSTLQIVGPIGGATGGVGQYTLSNAANVGAETMWSLWPYPGGAIGASQVAQNFYCRNGKTSIDTISGALNPDAVAASPGTTPQPIYIELALWAESGGVASFKNGQIFILSPGPFQTLTGGLVQ